MNNNAIKEFLPLVIIAMSALLAAGIVVGDLTQILFFVLFLEALLLSYFMSSLSVNGTIKIASKMIFLAILVISAMLIATVANILFQGTCINIFLAIAIVLMTTQIIIVYRNR